MRKPVFLEHWDQHKTLYLKKTPKNKDWLLLTWLWWLILFHFVSDCWNINASSWTKVPGLINTDFLFFNKGLRCNDSCRHKLVHISDKNKNVEPNKALSFIKIISYMYLTSCLEEASLYVVAFTSLTSTAYLTTMSIKWKWTWCLA